MIALILGGAQSVWADLAEAQALLGGGRHLVVATNSASFLHEGRIDALATLHPELLAGWQGKRTGNSDYRVFSPAPAGGCEVVPERWPASSGGYGMQIALYTLGATAAILCGVPLEREAGHIVQPGLWSPPTSYRVAFAAALPIIGARVRSMGGWTRELFGPPTAEWLAAMGQSKPLSRPRPPRTALMHHVTNATDQTQRFTVYDQNGEMQMALLLPGESGTFEVDVAQARFVRGELKATPVGGPTADAPAPDTPSQQSLRRLRARR